MIDKIKLEDISKESPYYDIFKKLDREEKAKWKMLRYLLMFLYIFLLFVGLVIMTILKLFAYITKAKLKLLEFWDWLVKI